jgi:putative tricarboxylic transport membrane protein
MILLGFGLAYGYGGRFIRVGFYNGDFGPHHWIYIVASALVLLGFGLVLRPTQHQFEVEVWEDWRKRLPLIGAIVIYSLILPYIGFLGAMIAMMIVVAKLFGANWKQAILCSVILSFLCLLLFDHLLGISLGRGLWLK